VPHRIGQFRSVFWKSGYLQLKGGKKVGSFSFQLNEKVEDALKRIEEVAKNKGIQFQYHGTTGSFSHMGVVGSFTINEDTVEIEYTKPGLFPDSVVEAQIMQIFN
jgi:hypothetical protein